MVRRILLAAYCIVLVSTIHAASPSLSQITPRGFQRGQETILSFRGARLADAQEILYYSPGFETVKIEKAEKGRVDVRVKIAADCRLGVHQMRVRTATGISDLKTFYVGALKDVAESEPNSEFDSPQRIELNSTVSGVVANEDVDYYAFEAKKGQRLSAEVEAMRLGVSIFDVYIAILDAKRFELSSSDDTALLKQDATCQAIAPSDGTYYLQVRESSYGGSGNAKYRLHVGSFPRPLAIFPAGGKPGQKLEVEFIGDAGGSAKQSIQLPDAVGEHGVFRQDEAGIAPSPNLLRVNALENTTEVEPNEHWKKASKATGSTPGAFNGILGEPGDIDYFSFKAEKGQVFDVEVYGRRLRSPIDPVLNIYHLGGARIAGNDDSRGPDSYLRFTAPETKEYAVRIYDHLRGGGPSYVYRIEFRPVKPKLSLTIPRVGRYSQERQSIAVPRGGRMATLINASRENFGGDLVFDLPRGPAGVKIHCENMPGNLTSVPILFEASSNAAVAGGLFDFVAKHADPKQKIGGGFEVGIDLLYGAPGQSIYLAEKVSKLAVAVTEEAPFSIEIVEPKVPLVRSGSMALKVIAKRKEGFDAPIRLEMVFSPPGVTAQRNVTIPKGKTEARIALNANGGAQLRDWKIVVNGVGDAGQGPIWTASQLATLRVAAPYLTLEVQKGSVDQGQSAELFVKVNHATPFEGKAKIRLQGLPHKVTSKEFEVGAEMKEFSFPVQVAKESPAGRHKNIFCRVEITQNGEPVVHSTGGTELRIDKPLPPKKPKPKAKKVVKAPPKPKAKKPAAPKKRQLTRLEKLRLEFKKRNGEEPAEEGGEK